VDEQQRNRSDHSRNKRLTMELSGAAKRLPLERLVRPTLYQKSDPDSGQADHTSV